MAALLLSVADYAFAVRVARLLEVDAREVADLEHKHARREVEHRNYMEGHAADTLAVADDLLRKQFVRVSALIAEKAGDLRGDLARTFPVEYGFAVAKEQDALVRFLVRFVYDGDESDRRTLSEESARFSAAKFTDVGVRSDRPTVFLCCALMCGAREALRRRLPEAVECECALHKIVRRLFDKDHITTNAEHLWRAARAKGDFSQNYTLLSADPLERRARSL